MVESSKCQEEHSFCVLEIILIYLHCMPLQVLAFIYISCFLCCPYRLYCVSNLNTTCAYQWACVIVMFSPPRGQCLSWCNRLLILSLCKRLTAIQITCKWDRELMFWQDTVITRNVCGDNVLSAFGWLMLHFVSKKRNSPLWGLSRDWQLHACHQSLMTS